jgi:hypothetical protein
VAEDSSKADGAAAKPAASGKIKLTLSPQAEKYARRDAPLGVRRMAARGALPLEPIELATVLFALMHDPDAEAKATARESLESLRATVRDAVVSGPAHPSILSLLAQVHRDDEPVCEKLALNPATDDRTIAFLGGLPFRAVVEIVSQNQERMLRCEEIVESLGSNPLTGRSVIDRLLEFLGVEAEPDGSEEAELDETDAKAAVLALLGDELSGFASQLAQEDKEDVGDDAVGGNLFAALQKMSIIQKIKLARLGGKEARGLLIRDCNKVVAAAAISSPKISDSEVAGFARSRNVCDEVLRVIAKNRDWTRHYEVRLALATNPKCPQATSLKFINYLQDKDLKKIMKSRDVPSVVSGHARRLLQKKGKI